MGKHLDVEGEQPDVPFLGEDDEDAGAPSRSWLDLLAAEDDRATISLWTRALMSNWGGTVLWVGYWNLLNDTPWVDTENEYGSDPWGEGPLPERTLGYAFVGAALCFLSDTLYSNAGIPGGWMPDRVTVCGASFNVGRSPAVRAVRMIVGLFATITMWVGIFNYFVFWFLFTSSVEYYPRTDDDQGANGIGEDVWNADAKYFHKDAGLMLVGLALYWLTGAP